MSPADAAISQKRQVEIAGEARFYGYDLKTGEWSYTETTSQFLPDHLLLTYDERLPNNVTSRFVALVPRGKGRVRIIPAVTRGAVPLNKPYTEPRNLELFNNAVSQDLVKKILATDVGWLGLGAAYSAMVGGDPVVPQEGQPQTGNRVALIRLNTTQTTRVVVPDRSAEKGYTVWTVDFSKTGAVVAAAREDHWSPAPYIARNPETPHSIVRTPDENPKVIHRVPDPGPRPVERTPAPANVQPQPVQQTPVPTPAPQATKSNLPVTVPAGPANAASAPVPAQTTEPASQTAAPAESSHVVVMAPAAPAVAVVRNPSETQKVIVRHPAAESVGVIVHPTPTTKWRVVQPAPAVPAKVVQPAAPAPAKVTSPAPVTQ